MNTDRHATGARGQRGSRVGWTLKTKIILTAGGVCAGGTRLLEIVKLDDVVGAVPAHLFAGIWGTLEAYPEFVLMPEEDDES